LVLIEADAAPNGAVTYLHKFGKAQVVVKNWYV